MTLIIACPHCSTGYMLPVRLVGPGGARVRCPRCQELFAVDAEGHPVEAVPAPAPPDVAPVPAAVAVAPGISEPAPEISPATPGVTAPAPEVLAPTWEPAAPRAETPAPVRESAAAAPEEPTVRVVEEQAPSVPAKTVSDEQREAALSALDELAAKAGGDLGRAARERRLFTEFGPSVMEAFEAYRRRVGRGADPAPFREALRERWGVELVPLVARQD